MADSLPPLQINDNEDQDDFIQRISFSARGYKGQLTRAVEAAERVLDFAHGTPSPACITHLETSIKDAEKQYNHLECRMQELISYSKDEDECKDHQADLGTYFKKFDKIRGLTVEFISQIQLPAIAPIAPNAGAGAAAAAAPADLFFGRRQRSALPGLRALSLSLPLQETAAKRSAGRRDVKDKFDSHASPLPPLQAGEEVVLRDPARRAWIGEGTIIQPRRDDQLSYEVQLPGEASTIRNRTWIKKKNVEFSDV